MVRDSVTFRVARDKLTGELPQQLQINPFNQTVRAIEVDNFQKGLRGVWQHATLPARKTISKLILMCTRNNNYTKFIQEKLGSRPKTEELDGIGLSKLQRRLIARVEGMEGYVNYILEKLDPLTDKAEWSETDKEQLRLFLEEKLFTYDMFIRMLIGFDIKDMDDLERVYFRKKEKIRQNYERFRENTREIREGFDMEKLESRRQYFRELLGDKLESLSHFSRVNNVQALIGGRRLLDRQWGDILAEISVTNTTRAIDTALSVEKSSSQIPNLADKILRHFRQDALRAVDRVNDIFGTDRFIYFLLSGQTINSPVARLPYIYTMNKLPKTSKGLIINFSAPSHPQAIHAIKMFRDLAEMPTILEEGIKMFSKGLYLPDDFKKMVVDIFSLNFRQNEINQDMFDFIFNNLVVNEDGELKVKNENYVFSDWLEIDYEKRGNINWKMATQIVTRINHFCSKVGIISPLRPYVVMKKDLVVTELGISVMKNPASAIQ